MVDWGLLDFGGKVRAKEVFSSVETTYKKTLSFARKKLFSRARGVMAKLTPGRIRQLVKELEELETEPLKGIRIVNRDDIQNIKVDISVLLMHYNIEC